VGVTNRETALLLLPSDLASRRAWPDRSPLSSAILVWIVHLMTLVVLVVGKAAAAGLLAPGADWSSMRYGGASARLPQMGDLADVYTEFGALWIVAVLGLVRARARLAVVLPYAVLVVLQVLIARGDESRVLSHLFPFVLLASALELGAIWSRVPRGPARWVPLGLLVLGAALSMVHFRWTIVPWSAVRYSCVGLGTLLVLGVLAWLQWRSPRGVAQTEG
jgi:hypothetical protein